MQPKPWPALPVEIGRFRKPPREFGILPFWFLNGELKPEEMQFQLKEFYAKGMPGIILHGRFGLEVPYIDEVYMERIKYAVQESEKLGLQTWIYDEMNWPSGTADKRVLQGRPDLAQRYIECIYFNVRGPWFTYLTGADSRYLDFERSTPVAAFAIGSQDGGYQVIDLTPNLSFRDVIPWEVPSGNWKLIYIVEKTADYYIDSLNPEATAEFLRLGYEPYANAVNGKLSSQVQGFYTDEPAMHYYLTGADNPVVPWTKDMFRRFQQRNGYNLRPRLPELFFDLGADSARVRYDFYNSLTEFYSQAYYQQIHEWCQAHDVLFTGHLLYEEWLRRLVRVEGNVFKHYPHMDVIGVDHLYPIVGNQDRPDEHVAMKVGSSAAHQLGSERLLCESFGGIFMDATMQRMKWIADWEYVLGVNLLNPHGFHYTLEGPRKRDWPPSMFYQYPWWQYYGHFSDYISRLSHLLSGGKHIAKVAVLWPMNAMFATYTPQEHNELNDRITLDFNTLTDLLLRLHYDFDFLDEDMLLGAGLEGQAITIRDEAYELVILPPMTHIKLATLERLEQFVTKGGRVLGMIFLPDLAFTTVEGKSALVDISERMTALFGVNPKDTMVNRQQFTGIEVLERMHGGGGKTGFLRSYALARQLPLRLQEQLGCPGTTESSHFIIEADNEASRYFFTFNSDGRQEITEEVVAERKIVAEHLQQALNAMISPDVTIDNREVFYLHRVKDNQDIYFLVNSTFKPQMAQVTLQGEIQPLLWDPSIGEEQPIAPWHPKGGRTSFALELPAVGSAFVLTRPGDYGAIIDTNLTIRALDAKGASGYGQVEEGFITFENDGLQRQLTALADRATESFSLAGEWQFKLENDNALVIGKWQATQQTSGTGIDTYTHPDTGNAAWLPMVPGAWSYQLPVEPEIPYPIPVWYQIRFHAAYIPQKLDLIVDGFAASEWNLYVNGEAVPSVPVRSQFDSQMKAVEITPYLQTGENLIALRMVLTSPTDGLLDLLKLVGDFSLARDAGGDYQIVAPVKALTPNFWSVQGYPYFSGRATYCRQFDLPGDSSNRRVFLEAEMKDDALEVIVNETTAGVRLWGPYRVEITDLLKAGQNTLELRVANTLVNLLEGVERPSGLAGAPQIISYPQFEFSFL